MTVVTMIVGTYDCASSHWNHTSHNGDTFLMSFKKATNLLVSHSSTSTGPIGIYIYQVARVCRDNGLHFKFT